MLQEARFLLLLGQHVGVRVPLVRRLDLLRPRGGEPGLPLQVLEQLGRVLPGLRLVDAEHASIFVHHRAGFKKSLAISN